MSCVFGPLNWTDSIQPNQIKNKKIELTFIYHETETDRFIITTKMKLKDRFNTIETE